MRIEKSEYYLSYSNVFIKEKEKERERKRDFKLIKRYKNFDLYEHKTAGYKECFSHEKR